MTGSPAPVPPSTPCDGRKPRAGARPAPGRRLAAALILATALLGLPGCGGGSSDRPAPVLTTTSPSGLTVRPGSDFDTVELSWTAPTTPFDGYTLEVSVAGDEFRPLTATPMPSSWLGVILSLDPDTPELLDLDFRIRVERGSISSGYSNTASLFRGVRPPARGSASLLKYGVALAWTKASRVADQVRLERSVLGPDGVPGTWASIGGLAPEALSYLDGDLLEGTQYAYRITNVKGAVASLPLQVASPVFPISTPAALAAVPQEDGIHLVWTNRSSVATGIVVWRSAGGSAGYTDIASPMAELPPGAAAFTDADPFPGAYAYYLEIKSATASIWSPIVTATYQRPGAPVLVPQTLTLPAASWMFLSPGGTLCLSLDDHRSPGLRLPDGSGWTAHPALGTLWAYPYVRFDRQDHPHFVSLRPASGSAWELIHEWYDGMAWRSEPILTRTVYMDPNQSAPGLVFELDSNGGLHLVLDEGQGTLPSTSSLYYLHKEGEVWMEESLDLLPSIPTYNRLALALDPDGAPHVVLWGCDLNGHEFSRAVDGSWTATLIPGTQRGDGAFSQLVCLAPDRALLAFDQPGATASSTGEVDLMCAERVSGIWQPPYRLGPVSVVGARSDGDMAGSSDHGRAALLANALAARILYLYAGGAWTAVALAPRFPGYPRNPSVVFDSAGRVAVCGRDDLATGATATYTILRESP